MDLFEAGANLAGDCVTSKMDPSGFGAIMFGVIMIIGLPFFLFDKCSNSEQNKAAKAKSTEVQRKTIEEIKKSDTPIRDALKQKAKDKAVEWIMK